jgi:hypothetical protein
MSPKRRTFYVWLWNRFPFAAVVWMIVLGFGFDSLITYQMKAGAPAITSADWPEGVNLKFDPLRCNLVMFAHPKCPCSDASLEELKILMTQGRGEINPTICFFDPEGVPADWAQTSLVRAAMKVPGLNVVIDEKGVIAERFGALTSGQVLMFDRSGRRVFAGGITGSRGHAGDNRGRALVLALAKGDIREPQQTPVFGCALHDAMDERKEAL